MNGAKTLIGLATQRSRPKISSILGIGPDERDDLQGLTKTAGSLVNFFKSYDQLIRMVLFVACG